MTYLNRFRESFVGDLLGMILGATVAAVIVFGFAYGQQLAIWNWTISLGPDLYVAGAWAIFAWVLTFIALWMKPSMSTFGE